MGCLRCQERRETLGAFARSAIDRDISAAARQLAEVNKSMGEDILRVLQISGQRLAAAHARLKRS